MRISFGIKNALPLLACLILLPKPAYAHGMDIPASAMIIACIVIMTPGMLAAFTMTKGDVRARVQALLATLFISCFFAPALFFVALFGGPVGIGIAAIVPFVIGVYMTYPKTKGEKATTQSVNARFSSLFFPLLIAIALWAAYSLWDELRWKYTHGELNWSSSKDDLSPETTAAENIEAVRQSAESGDAAAQAYLASSYRTGGNGVAYDPKLALHWYLKAAPTNSYNVLFALGELYQRGEGTEKNGPEAVKWYREAMKWASPMDRNRIMETLGGMYERGDGVTLDRAEAYSWYYCAQIAHNALYFLSKTMTDEQAGEGRIRGEQCLANSPEPPASMPFMSEVKDLAPQDAFAEALKLLKPAAELGNADAAWKMCVIYMQGKAVKQDYSEAYFWCRVSQQRYALYPQAMSGKIDPQGDVDNARILGKLTEEQIEGIEKRLKEWKPGVK